MHKNQRFMHPNRLMVAVAVTLLAGIACVAQEVASINLTQSMAADRQPRRPEPGSHGTIDVRGGTREVHECAARISESGQLRSTLVGLDRNQYQVGDNIRFEVRVTNTGTFPISLPVAPYLADVQAADAGQKFRYSELVVKLWIGGLRWSADTGGTLTLYGAADHPGTMVMLQRGEWVTIFGQSTIALSELGIGAIRAGDVVRQANTRVSLYDSQTLLTATATATVSNGICINQSHGQSMPVKVGLP
jgi:hypothetical protein